MIEAKCSFNSVNKFLIMISLLVLPIIVIITIFYFLNLKQNNLDKMQEEFILKAVPPPDPQTPCTKDTTEEAAYNKISDINDGSIKNIPILKTPNVDPSGSCSFMDTNTKTPYSDRRCEVLFEKEDVCNNANNLCKFTFPVSWVEFKEVQDPTNPNTLLEIPKKYFGPKSNNVSDKSVIANYNLETKCYKESDGKEASYEFDVNDIVRKDCNGNASRGVARANRFKFSGTQGSVEKDYASIIFDVENKNADTIYKNVLKTVCSIKYDTIDALGKDKLRFFRFNLDGNNNIVSLEKVALNNAQTKFTPESFNINKLVSGGTTGMAFEKYENGKYFFKIFENRTVPLKNIEIFKFNYNYLCGNVSNVDDSPQESQIINFENISGKVIDMGQLFTLGGGVRSTTIDFRFDGIDTTLFDNELYNSTEPIDQKENIKDRFQTLIDNRKNYFTQQSNTRVNTICGNICAEDRKIAQKNTDFNTFKEGLNFATVAHNKGLENGYYQKLEYPSYELKETETIKKRLRLKPGLSVFKYQGYWWSDLTRLDNLEEIFRNIGGINQIYGLANATNAGGMIQNPDWGRWTYTNCWTYWYYDWWWSRQWHQYTWCNWHIKRDEAGAATDQNKRGNFNYTYVWKGFFKPKTSDNYIFYISADDHAAIIIDTGEEKLKISHAHRYSNAIRLEKDKYYPIMIFYGEAWGYEDIYFWWITVSNNQWHSNGTDIFFSSALDGSIIVETEINKINISNNNVVSSYYYLLKDVYDDQGTEYEINISETDKYEILMVGGGGGGGRDGGGGGGGGQVKLLSDRCKIKTDVGYTLTPGKYIVRIGKGGMHAKKINLNNAECGGSTFLYRGSAIPGTEILKACGGGGGGSKRFNPDDPNSGNSVRCCPDAGTGGEGHDWYSYNRDAPNPQTTASAGGESSSGYIGGAGGCGIPQYSENIRPTTTIQQGDSHACMSVDITGQIVDGYGAGGGGGTWTGGRGTVGGGGSGDGATCHIFAESGEDNKGAGGGGGGNEWCGSGLGGHGGSGVFILRKNIGRIDATDNVNNMKILENVVLSQCGSLVRHPKVSMTGPTTTKEIEFIDTSTNQVSRRSVSLKAKASSEARSTHSSDPWHGQAWKLFNYNTSGYENESGDRNWYHSTQEYDKGVAKTLRWRDDTNYKGEYIMIDLGYEIKLWSVKFVIRPGLSQRAPGKFRIYATNTERDFINNNFKNWNTPLYETSSKIQISDYTNGNGSAGVTVKFSNSYRFYAIVVNELAGNREHSDYLNFNEIILYESINVNVQDDVNTLSQYNRFFKNVSKLTDNDHSIINNPSELTKITDSDKKITIETGKLFRYRTTTYVFLQKGYHKFTAGFLNANSGSSKIAFLSELHIVLQDKMNLLHGMYSEIIDINALEPIFQYYSYTPDKHLYVSESGFYQIYFRSHGYNYGSTTVELNFKICFDYYSYQINKGTESNPQYEPAYENLSNIANITYTKNTYSSGFINLNSKKNGTTDIPITNFTLSFYNRGELTFNADIFKRIYSSDLHTDDTSHYKSNFDVYADEVRPGSQYDIKPESDKKSTFTQLKTDTEKYYNILMGEQAEDPTFKFEGNSVVKDANLRNWEKYKRDIDNVSIESKLSELQPPIPVPCMKKDINIFDIIGTVNSSDPKILDGTTDTDSQTKMITIEKFPYDKIPKNSDGKITGELPNYDSVEAQKPNTNYIYKSIYLQYFTSLTG